MYYLTLIYISSGGEFFYLKEMYPLLLTIVSHFLYLARVFLIILLMMTKNNHTKRYKFHHKLNSAQSKVVTRS